MKTRWKNLAKRIDAMSLRERAILFLSLALVMAAVADSLVLSPALAEQQALSDQLKKQANELKALRQQLAQATQPSAPDTPQGRLQAEVAQFHARQKVLDSDIQRRMSGPEELAKLPDLLERALRRHARLTLLKLATRNDPPGAAPTRLRWQGVDLSVSGSYLDLTNYLAELEKALPGLRWGELHIGTAASPPVLSVRLYLVGETR